jgi:probable rRNA maturation factor
MININFINEYNKEYDYLLDLYNKINQNIIKVLDLQDDYDVSVTLIDNKRIHEINREYRDVDRATDVISFANDLELSFAIDEATDLGDIFISVEQALKQAEEYHHSVERELSFLYVHGILHCLGYDHLNKEDEEEMIALQEVILNEKK